MRYITPWDAEKIDMAKPKRRRTHEFPPFLYVADNPDAYSQRQWAFNPNSADLVLSLSKKETVTVACYKLVEVKKGRPIVKYSETASVKKETVA